jgi:hypothetical protein
VRTRCSPSAPPSACPASSFGRPGCSAWSPLPGADAARLAHSRIGVSSGRSNGLDGARRGKSSFTCHNSLID